MVDRTRQLDVVDFHCHHLPAQFTLTAGLMAPPPQRPRWEAIGRKLADESLLVKDADDDALHGRVVNIPLGLMSDADGLVAHETIKAVNDHMAGLAARHPNRIFALGSVDPYDGDRGAMEAERAIRDLGLRGLFVDCGRGSKLIDAPEARPTLEVAARYRVPVFVHPIAPEPQTRQMTPYGVIGTLFARGTVNGAALIALVEGGVFAQLPDLRIVVTAHAIGALAMASGLSGMSRNVSGAIEVLRRHVCIDTQMIHPTLIRAAADLLGADRVLAGSDWPVVDDGPIRGPLTAALLAAGFSEAEQQAIAGGNCLRLFGIKSSAPPIQSAHTDRLFTSMFSIDGSLPSEQHLWP